MQGSLLAQTLDAELAGSCRTTRGSSRSLFEESFCSMELRGTPAQVFRHHVLDDTDFMLDLLSLRHGLRDLHLVTGARLSRCRLHRLDGLYLCMRFMCLLVGKVAQCRCTCDDGLVNIRNSLRNRGNTGLLTHIRQRFLQLFALIHHLMLLPIQVAGYDLVMLGLLQLRLGNVQLITLSYRQQALYKISFIGFLFADKIHHRARCLLHRLESLDLCMRFTCLLVGKAM
mmetsp:Transcript_68676/g.173624  ORF Transcript_68676/g.173624 Transcript_68676/m.173624 type:complete len:228 (-) Transcript_68676:1159-1842(-)